MQVVTIPSNTEYTNLYTLSGFAAGTSLLVTNNTSSTLSINQSETQPADSSESFPIVSDKTVLVQANEHPIWIRGNTGPVIVQSLLETVVPFTGVDLPHDTWTWSQEGFRRLRVDTSQTSLFTGHQFRTFKELSIGAGATYLIKVNVPVDTILWNVSLTIDAGSVKLSTYVGGTPSVTPDDVIPVIPKNTMSSRPEPFYVAQNTLVGETATLDGGTLIDVARVVTAGATAQQITVGLSNFGERGVGIGEYWWVFSNFGTGTATGVFSAYWEERPV